MSESKSDALPLGESPTIFFGIPPGTRTPTNGFGDRYAAITPARYVLTFTDSFEIFPTN